MDPQNIVYDAAVQMIPQIISGVMGVFSSILGDFYVVIIGILSVFLIIAGFGLIRNLMFVWLTRKETFTGSEVGDSIYQHLHRRQRRYDRHDWQFQALEARKRSVLSAVRKNQEAGFSE